MNKYDVIVGDKYCLVRIGELRKILNVAECTARRLVNGGGVSAVKLMNWHFVVKKDWLIQQLREGDSLPCSMKLQLKEVQGMRAAGRLKYISGRELIFNLDLSLLSDIDDADFLAVVHQCNLDYIGSIRKFCDNKFIDVNYLIAKLGHSAGAIAIIKQYAEYIKANGFDDARRKHPVLVEPNSGLTLDIDDAPVSSKSTSLLNSVFGA